MIFLNNFDCVIIGKKLNSGNSTNKDTGVVKPWTDLYTPEGSVVRVYGFDGSSLSNMAECQCHCKVRVFDNRAFVSFVKILK